MMAKEGNFLSQVFIMLLIKHGNTVRIYKLETDFDLSTHAFIMQKSERENKLKFYPESFISKHKEL